MQNIKLETESAENHGYYEAGGDNGLKNLETSADDGQNFTEDELIEGTGGTNENIPQLTGGGGTNSFSGDSGDQEINEAKGDRTAETSDAAKDHETSLNSKLKGKDDDKRKLFVGGLSWDTKEKDLKEYFSKFGDVEGLTYKTDAVTGRPRGFAFIIFTELSSVEQVLATGEHVINGKKVDPKRAKARPGKIFVGGLTNDISNDAVKDYFSKFGNVVDMEVPIDKSTNQRKNYCFVTFDDIAISQELLKNPKQTISGKEVDIKQAVPMAKPPHGGGWHESTGSARGRGRGGSGMRGRGGWGGGYGGYAAPAYSAWPTGGYAVGEGYGGYEYDGYYEGYDSYGGGYDAYSRGRGRGGFGGKVRGGGRGVPRHTPY